MDSPPFVCFTVSFKRINLNSRDSTDEYLSEIEFLDSCRDSHPGNNGWEAPDFFGLGGSGGGSEKYTIFHILVKK